MKRKLILLGLMFALTGCGNNAAQNPSTTSGSATVAPALQQDDAELHSTKVSQPVSVIDTVGRPAKLVMKAGVARKGSALCNIEYIDGEGFSQDIVRGQTNMIVTGWVGDEISRVAPTQPTLRLVNVDQRSQQWEIPLKLGVRRPDVAAHFQEPGLSETGFLQEISLQTLPEGRYHLFVAYTSDGVFYTCDNGRHFVIG